MDQDDILRMMFERGNAMQSFWGFYITVSLALIGFFGHTHRSTLLTALMSCAFIGFAFFNGGGIFQAAKQRRELFNLLIANEASDSPGAKGGVGSDLVRVSRPPYPVGVMVFHIAADLGVLAALWILTLYPAQGAQV